MSESEDKTLGIQSEAIKNLKESDERQWDAIEKLQNRLPIWATTVISILTFFSGCTLTYAVMLARTTG